MSSQSGGSVVYDLDVDKSKLSDGLSSAKSEVANAAKEMDDSIRESSNNMAKSFKQAQDASFAFAKGLVAVGAAGLAAVGFGVKIAADIETMRAGFVTLLGSADKADAAIAQIKIDAAATPFELPGLISANQLLTSVTKDANRSETFLLNIGKALTAMGKGQPELDRIIVNLQQIGSVGHASAIDIKQFAFAGIPIYELLNKALEKTTLSTVDNSKKIGTQTGKLQDLQNALKVAEQRQKEFNSKTKESTKIANQNSIDKYRSQISNLGGSLGKLTEENGKAVASQGKLGDAIRDGKITFELLEKVFNDAGTGSGQFAKAFTEQAGTFNQLISNFKDNIGIAASEIVQSTGIFNEIKVDLSLLVDVIKEFTPDAIQGVKNFFQFVRDNGPIISGIIIGGLTPAFIVFAGAVISSVVALAPFIAAGALLGVLFSDLSAKTDLFKSASNFLGEAFHFIADGYNIFLKGALIELFYTITTQLIPSLQSLWTQLSPVLIPVLKLIAAIIAGAFVGSLFIAIEAVNGIATVISEFIDKLNAVIFALRAAVITIKDIFSGVYDYITQPFLSASETIKKTAQSIKDDLEKINPFHRNSPSLVDNVTAGVKEIKDQYKSLSDLAIPRVSGYEGGASQGSQIYGGSNGASQTSRTNNNNVTIYVDKVAGIQDIEMLNREIGFKTSIMPAA